MKSICPFCHQACSSRIDGPHRKFIFSPAGEPEDTALDFLIDISQQQRGNDQNERPYVDSVYFECVDRDVQDEESGQQGYTLGKPVLFWAAWVDLTEEPGNPKKVDVPDAAAIEHWWLAQLPSLIFNKSPDLTGAALAVNPLGRRIWFRETTDWASMATDGASPGIQVPPNAAGGGWQSLWLATEITSAVRIHAEVTLRWLACPCGNGV